MDEKFQDRIDDYLLDRMGNADKKAFLQEIEQDDEKREQLEFTRHVKDSIRSREEKLQALAQFQRRYEEERRTSAFRAMGTECVASCCPAPEVAATKPVLPKKRIWLWIPGVAALIVVGFFAVRLMIRPDSSPNYKGIPVEKACGRNGVFGSAPADSTDNDTIKSNIGTFQK